jgi:hypothetical protein
MPDRPLYAIFGHHKCATMWLEDIARLACQRLNLNLGVVYDEDQFGRDLPAWLARERADFLVYGNADIEFSRSLPPFRGVHVIRDPRDIVVSAYYSHLHSHSTSEWKELVSHRERLQALDKEAGLAEEIRFRGRSFGHMATWDYDQENVLEIRFEDITVSSYETVLAAFEWMGLVDDREVYTRRARAGFLGRDIIARINARTGGIIPTGRLMNALPAPEVLAIVWHHRYARRAKGREKGKEDVRSHYRSGRSGDWRDHFSDDHKALFKSLYPGLVPQLGYEQSDDW